MGRYLKHAVGGRVNNRPSSSHVLLTQLLDDFSPRCRFVAEHSSADRVLEWPDYSRRKPVWISRERPLCNDASHFPVTGSRILAARRGCGLPKRAARVIDGIDRQAPDVSETHLTQVRDLNLARTERVPQRIRARVAVIGGIGHLTNANAVEHYKDYSVERTKRGH